MLSACGLSSIAQSAVFHSGCPSFVKPKSELTNRLFLGALYSLDSLRFALSLCPPRKKAAAVTPAPVPHFSRAFSPPSFACSVLRCDMRGCHRVYRASMTLWVALESRKNFCGVLCGSIRMAHSSGLCMSYRPNAFVAFT